MFAQNFYRKRSMSVRNVMILLYLCISFAPSGAAAHGDEGLKLGVIPYTSPRTVVKLYAPVASLLSKALDVNVRVVTAASFDQYMQRVFDRQYDIIVLGSTFYFKAHDRADYQAVARGYPSFRAGIIVLQDSAISSIEQLQGKSMAAVNIKDRGGYKLQKMALLKRGVDVDEDVDVFFSGSNDSVIYAVLSGQNDAGAIRLDALQKPVFSQVRKKIKIIYTSPENPQFPFAVRQDMDPAMVVKIASALTSISMKKPETVDILNSLNIHGFEQVSSDQLEELRLVREEQAKKMGSTR